MAHLLTPPRSKFFDTNGDPLANGKLYSYIGGTTTPKVTYQSQTELSSNTNPVILDSNGEANVWLGAGAYKLILKTSADVPVYTWDQISHINANTITLGMIPDELLTGAKILDGTITEDEMADNSIPTRCIQDEAVTPPKIPNESIAFEKLDPDMDLTQFGNVIELAWGNRFFQNKPLPQYPWSTPSLMSNPGTLPAGAGHNCKWSHDGRFLAVAHEISPYLTIYERQGTRLNKLTNPDSLPPGLCYDISWSPDGTMLAVGSDTTPFLVIYRRYGSNFVKLPNVATLPGGVGAGVAWSPNGDFLAVAHTGTPWLTVYQVIRKSVALETSTMKYYEFTITPGVAYTGDVYDANGAGVYVVFASTTSTKLIAASSTVPAVSGTLNQTAEAPSGDTRYGSAAIAYSAVRAIDIDIETIYFSKLSNPASLPGDASGGGHDPEKCAWSPDGRYLAVASEKSTYLFIYELSGTTLTLVSDTASLAATIFSVTFSPDGNFLVCGMAGTPYVKIFGFSAGSCSAISNPTNLPAGEVVAGAWSPNGEFLALAEWASPFITVYQRSGNTFTKLANPVDLPPGNGFGLDFSPDGQFLVHVSDTTPYISTYQTVSTLPTKGILYMRG